MKDIWSQVHLNSNLTEVRSLKQDDSQNFEHYLFLNKVQFYLQHLQHFQCDLNESLLLISMPGYVYCMSQHHIFTCMCTFHLNVAPLQFSHLTAEGFSGQSHLVESDSLQFTHPLCKKKKLFPRKKNLFDLSLKQKGWNVIWNSSLNQERWAEERYPTQLVPAGFVITIHPEQRICTNDQCSIKPLIRFSNYCPFKLFIFDGNQQPCSFTKLSNISKYWK